MKSEIITKHYKNIKSYIHKRERDKSIVEDLVQEVCIKLMEYPDVDENEWPRIVNVIHKTIYNYKRSSSYNLIFKSSNGTHIHKLRTELMSLATKEQITHKDINSISEKLSINHSTVLSAFQALFYTACLDDVADSDNYILDLTTPESNVESIDYLTKLLGIINKLPRIEREILLDKYLFETNKYKQKLPQYKYTEILSKAKASLKSQLQKGGLWVLK